MSEFDVLIQALVITVLMAVAYIMGRGDGWNVGFEDGRKYGWMIDKGGDAE